MCFYSFGIPIKIFIYIQFTVFSLKWAFIRSISGPREKESIKSTNATWNKNIAPLTKDNYRLFHLINAEQLPMKRGNQQPR
jgi:hypothetical protein